MQKRIAINRSRDKANPDKVEHVKVEVLSEFAGKERSKVVVGNKVAIKIVHECSSLSM
jgi:hypothetical protein